MKRLVGRISHPIIVDLGSVQAATDRIITLQIALCESSYNILGVVLFYPIPFIRRIPIRLAKKLGNIIAEVSTLVEGCEPVRLGDDADSHSKVQNRLCFSTSGRYPIGIPILRDTARLGNRGTIMCEAFSVFKDAYR